MNQTQYTRLASFDGKMPLPTGLCPWPDSIIIESWHLEDKQPTDLPLRLIEVGCLGGLPGTGTQPHPAPLKSSCTPRLKDLFQRSSNLQYFKRLIQIPQLPEVSVPVGPCLLGCAQWLSIL